MATSCGRGHKLSVSMRGSKTEIDAMQASRTQAQICATNGRSNILENTEGKELMDMELARRTDVTREECIVDVENPLVEEERAQRAAQCIYRVPARIKNLEARVHAYKPQTVSIGPFHHGDPDLQPMEAHKRRALQHVVRRAGKNVGDFIAALEEVAEQLESAYMDLGGKWRGPRNRRRFLRLMVTDGCFLLEIMRTRNHEDYADNDPVFGLHGRQYTVPCICEDMHKIENQLPLLVLKRILDVETENSSVNGAQVNGDQEKDYYVNMMVLEFMSAGDSRMSAELVLGLHPLDIFRQSKLLEPYKETSPCFENMENSSTESDSAMDVCIYRCRGQWLSTFPKKIKPDRVSSRYSAVKLYKAGIRFKSGSDILQEIHFDSKKGLLTMPLLEMDDTTEQKLLNMMAFENLHVTATYGVTRYVLFMEEILRSAKDVKRLRKEGLVVNNIGPDEEVARMFNRLTKDIQNDTLDVLKEINDYLGRCFHSWFNKWWGHFVHTYFHNPLMAISLLAATVLLALTVVQTICAVMSLNNGKNS